MNSMSVMDYREQFSATVQNLVDTAGLAVNQDTFWPESLTDEGVAYGEEKGLPAPEAASWYLSAALLLRMKEGALGVPVASALIAEARRMARRLGLSEALGGALAKLDEERRSWVAAHHEAQGAGLRALRPVPSDPENQAWPEDDMLPAVDEFLEPLLAPHQPQVRRATL